MTTIHDVLLHQTKLRVGSLWGSLSDLERYKELYKTAIDFIELGRDNG